MSMKFSKRIGKIKIGSEQKWIVKKCNNELTNLSTTTIEQQNPSKWSSQTVCKNRVNLTTNANGEGRLRFKMSEGFWSFLKNSSILEFGFRINRRNYSRLQLCKLVNLTTKLVLLWCTLTLLALYWRVFWRITKTKTWKKLVKLKHLHCQLWIDEYSVELPKPNMEKILWNKNVVSFELTSFS